MTPWECLKCCVQDCDYEAVTRSAMERHGIKIHGFPPRVSAAIARLAEEIHRHNVRLAVAVELPEKAEA